METHILLIDDDMDEPEILINALRDANIQFKCTWAAGPDQGFRELEKIHPDLILLDFNMPKINGLEMLRMLKQSAALQHIPVVMYSATMDKGLIEKAMSSGATGCIKKPYDMQELPSLLRPFL